MNIHKTHDATPAAEIEDMEDSATGQEQRVRAILKAHPDTHFGYFQIIDMTGYDKDSAKRALSNLSGSANHDRYKDRFGNWPVVYDKNYRKKNPHTGRTVGTYRWNPRYGKRPPARKNVGKDGQMSFIKKEHQNQYSEAGA